MWCIQISEEIYNIVAIDIEEIKYSTFFVSNNEEITQKVMDFLEKLPNSPIISSITLGVDLYKIGKYFQMVYIDDISEITHEQFPYDFICIEGIFNTFGKNKIEIQEYNNKYFNTRELIMIREKLGEDII
jgi:hypothetical protein